MNFTFSEAQWVAIASAHRLGVEFASPDDIPGHDAASVIARAAHANLLTEGTTLETSALIVQALAEESAGAAVTLAAHIAVVLALPDDVRFASLRQGGAAGAISLSSEHLPSEESGQVSGRASWVGPLTSDGWAVVGVRPGAGQGASQGRPAEAGRGEGVTAYAVPFQDPGVSREPVSAAALGGFSCGHLSLTNVPGVILGSPQPIMSRVRVLLAAAGLGMGARALREALQAARAYDRSGPGGEQTVQGLLADAATELDAARLLTWKAAASPSLSLAEASMAKLAVTEATQRAVARATQVVGGDSFTRGHIVERLAQDVRALELFAGRTEALRDAVAAETLPHQ